MSLHSEIDQTLHQLGTVVAPAGLERRIHARLAKAPRRFSLPVIYSVSGGALAAGLAISAVALNPTLHRAVFPAATPAPHVSTVAPRVLPANDGFHSASVVHVPAEPVPLQPSPVNQGRGRSRSGRGMLPEASVAPLPRGVAPGQPISHTSVTGRQ